MMFLGLLMLIAASLFIVLSAGKAYRYARMPLPGRMELYPVPAEKGRYRYGGSYMEEAQWWCKPRQVSKTNELIAMLQEMLFIKKLFQHQRSLWRISYAFHLGIYCIIAWTFLLLAGSLTELAGMPVNDRATLWTDLLYYLTIVLGSTGFIITTAGAALLLIRRVFDPVLKQYTTPQEYFNLLLLLTVLISGINVWSPDLTFAAARQVTAGVLMLNVTADTALLIHLLLLAVMFIYIPVSKMGHYVSKYFSFHKVLWENEPNIPGSLMENKVKTALSSHIQDDGETAEIKS